MSNQLSGKTSPVYIQYISKWDNARPEIHENVDTHVHREIMYDTDDIDFLITADDCAKIEPDLIKAGYSIFNRQDAFVQFKNERPGFRDLDFLIGDSHTKEQLISQGKKVTIAGKTFNVPSPLHLIAMKLHSMGGNRKRELKDFPDIVQIMIANGINPRDADVVEMFKKYNLMDLHERALKAIGAENEQ
jgi:hypothetical protein